MSSVSTSNNNRLFVYFYSIQTNEFSQTSISRRTHVCFLSSSSFSSSLRYWITMVRRLDLFFLFDIAGNNSETNSQERLLSTLFFLFLPFFSSYFLQRIFECIQMPRSHVPASIKLNNYTNLREKKTCKVITYHSIADKHRQR